MVLSQMLVLGHMVVMLCVWGLCLSLSVPWLRGPAEALLFLWAVSLGASW